MPLRVSLLTVEIILIDVGWVLVCWVKRMWFVCLVVGEERRRGGLGARLICASGGWVVLGRVTLVCSLFRCVEALVAGCVELACGCSYRKKKEPKAPVEIDLLQAMHFQTTI